MRNLLQQNTKKIIAASLVFWMSGVLFLFCCETTEASKIESCPLAKKSHCLKQTSSESVSQFASVQGAETLNCCRFLPQIFAQSANIEKNQKVFSIATAAKVLQPKFLILVGEFSAPKEFQSVVINRQATYLKNRVFRI